MTPETAGERTASTTAAQLETLVDRTAGLQPWRRVFHAANGVGAASALALLDIPRSTAVLALSGILVGMITLDAARLASRRANVIFFSAFKHLASPREATGPASSTWYALGILLAVAFFPAKAAVSGILVLALADPAASYVGRRWGRRPLLGATLEGSAVFAAVAFGILAARHGVGIGAAAAVLLTLAERLSWPLDDNLTIPVAGAAAVFLLQSVP
jgi:dolichol kinase